MTAQTPRPSRITRRRALRLAAVASLLASSGLGSAAHAAAPDPDTASPGHLTSAARAAGLTQAGGAFLGWSHRGVRGTQPLSPARTTPALATATTEGIDVSHYQGTVGWSSYYGAGSRFAYIKATEGTTYTDPQFSANYSGSSAAGFVRGAYHFARPDVSSGATQASYFLAHGGGWSRDGRTLPGALDIEYNPYGASCYGKSAASMVSWVQDFVSTYRAATGRGPVLYSTYDWWSTCTGNSSAFSSTSPWWIARYSSTVGSLPAGASTWTFWQYTDSPLDKDRFNGDTTRLTALANG